ncbi:hypothetical protein NSY55_27575 [Pseudomonas aeruginosa]|nr:hypothetical protein [Pseudomonas aeruginosa]
MNQHEAAVLLSKVAVLVEQFDRRCEETSQVLRQVTEQVPGVLQRAANSQVRSLPAEVGRVVAGGLEQPIATYEKRVRDAGANLQQASQTLAAQLRRAEAIHKQLIWKVAGTALASILILVALGTLLSRHYYEEIRRNQVSAELLKAYSQADVVLCDGRICAKVSKQAKRYGEYSVVESR